MRDLRLLLALGLLAAATRAGADDGLPAAAARLVGAVLVDGRAYEHARALTDELGPRLAGTAEEKRAAAWAAERLRGFGLADVRTETFPLPDGGWTRGAAELRLLAPVARRLHVSSVPWSPPTPRGGVRGEVVILDALTPDEIDARAASLRGRLVLMVPPPQQRRLGFEAMEALVAAAVPRVQAAGATAILWSARVPHQGVRAVGLKLPRPAAATLPAADVGLEDHELLVRLVGRGPVRVELRLDNRFAPGARSQNVLADLRGRELPDEWILVGAHLDSWDVAPGAQDNAAGVAMVLEAARAIVALGRPPRRSIRFVLWGAEEQNLAGSRAYARAHAAELDRIAVVINSDNGPGEPRGWNTGGRDDVAAALRPILTPLLADLGGAELSTEASCGSDHVPFLVRGIPTLEMAVDKTRYLEVHHQAGDTIDKVSRRNLASGAAILAVTAYAAAEIEKRPGGRVDEAAVDAAMARTDAPRCRQRLGR